MANIDTELAFLRDAGDYDGPISREAIANALRIMNDDKLYSHRTLVVTENGEYDAPGDEPYDTVVVNVDQPHQASEEYDGYVERFTIKKNGRYYSNDMFGGNYIITEFDVEVPTYIVEPHSIEINENGIYEPLPGQTYNNVVVNIPNKPHHGDYVSATFYFLDPSNPNDNSAIWIATTDHILMGTSAYDFIGRFPKFKQINGPLGFYYTHQDWNSDPRYITCDKDYVPSWVLDPIRYPAINEHREVSVDSEIFIYLAQHKIIDLYFDPMDVIHLYDYDTGLQKGTVIYYGKGVRDTYGTETTYAFSISIGEVPYCADGIDINTETTINGQYYWYGCSLFRAMINNDRSILITDEDRAYFDNAQYDIHNYIDQQLYDAAIPMHYGVTKPVPVDPNDRYYSKTVPRDNISYTRIDNTYYKVKDEDIPVDPSTGKQSPRYGDLYQRNERTQSGVRVYTFVKTTDRTIVSGKNYYDVNSDAWNISVDKPYRSDSFDNFYQRTCCSNYKNNLRQSSVLYLRTENNVLKAFKNVNGVETEITGEDMQKFADLREAPGDYYEKKCYGVYDIMDLMRGIGQKEGIYPDDIDMSRVYYKSYNEQYTHYYLYKLDYPKIYYTFPTGGSGQITRISEIDDKATIDMIDYEIKRRVIKRPIYVYRAAVGSSLDHEYAEEGDIWPDETLCKYAEGNYMEQYYEDYDTIYRYVYNFRPAGIEYFYFFNYYDIYNGMNTCPNAYHFVRSSYSTQEDKFIYRIEQYTSTDYSGYQSTTVNMDVKHTAETLTDKFLLSVTTIYPGLYPHDYILDRYAFNNGVMTYPSDYINTKIIADVENLERSTAGYECFMTFSSLDEPNESTKAYSMQTLFNGYTYNETVYDEVYPIDRNSNRYIYADQKTEKWFKEKRDEYDDNPGVNVMPTEEDTQTKWQEFYDDFPNFVETDDHFYKLYSPSNWGTGDTPKSFSSVTFYL